MAIGGSTNAIIHLIALAGRAGVDLPLTRFDELSRTTPMLLNVRPSGKYLMEDFFYAGGLPVVLKELLPLLHGGALTVTGKPTAENNAEKDNYNPALRRPPATPILNEGGTAIPRGNLCPGGAVLKQSAACRTCSPRGARGVRDHADLRAHRRPGPDVDETCVLVLKRVGPKGAPGMPEWGAAPIPKKLLQKGVKDMVRISDARMSGTSYGTVVLHVSPEAEAGGPLALVQNGDQIELDIPNRRLTLRVPDEELAHRRASWKPRPPHYTRGYGRLFLDHVLQVHEGCDFDFLRGKTPVRAEDTAGPSHS
jgi:dihydroxy-acid dehydratase